MTPAERARQIDREEFAAECAAIRQRAYARFGIKPQPDKRVLGWIQRQEPKGTIKPNFTPPPKRVQKARRPYARTAKLYTAFGHTRTLTEWATETGMSRNTIRNRLNIGWTLEDALTREVQKHAAAKARAALAADAGVKLETMRTRLKRGWNVEDAVSAKPKVTRSMLARKSQINPATVSSRLRRGWTLERALTEQAGTTMGRNSHRPKTGPGVVSNLSAPLGTGGGSHA